MPVVTSRVVDQTNSLRARNGLGPVRIEPQLSRAAQDFAEFIAASDRIGHDVDARTPAERVKAAGYEYCMLAENLAYVVDSLGFTTDQLAARLMQGWEKSPQHRRNLLLVPVTEVGVGLALGARSGRYYAVQLLARPGSAALHFEVANRAGVPVDYELDGDRYALAPLVTRLHTRCAEATLQLLGTDAARDISLTVQNGSHYGIGRDDSGRLRLRLE
ncbi:MAG TPA: CAP domain-containing protein [Burkholderiaceae bacterium]|nr:CAP domain-containing protein [Burkholderiaceae bacterium]